MTLSGLEIVVSKGVTDQIIQGRIFVNAAADRTINALVLFVVPNFSGQVAVESNACFRGLE